MIDIKVDISVCKEGDILTRDIKNKNDSILIGKNTILNDYMLYKLKDLRIENIWIYKESPQKYEPQYELNCKKIELSYKDTVVTMKALINNLACGGLLEYKIVNDIKEHIYKNIINSREVLEYLYKLNQYDLYTYNHSIKVAFYAMLIGKWIHLPQKDIKNIVLAGLLHDIGKVKIPIDVLNKRSKLTESEFANIKQHSELGYEMLKESNLMNSKIQEAVLMHHERMDGSGYPSAVKGECIGKYAKIIAVADVYDAMVSDRVYKKRATPFEAFEMFSTIGTSAFDYSITSTFLLNISTYLTGTKVQLSNGDIGIIVYIPPEEISKPIVQLRSTYVQISKNSNLQISNILKC